MMFAIAKMAVWGSETSRLYDCHLCHTFPLFSIPLKCSNSSNLFSGWPWRGARSIRTQLKNVLQPCASKLCVQMYTARLRRGDYTKSNPNHGNEGLRTHGFAHTDPGGSLGEVLGVQKMILNCLGHRQLSGQSSVLIKREDFLSVYNFGFYFEGGGGPFGKSRGSKWFEMSAAPPVQRTEFCA